MQPAKASAKEFVLQAKLTNLCNMRCEQCYNLRQGPASSELPTKSWRAILGNFNRFARRAGVKAHVHFIGGEPLLRPDLFELAGIATRTEGSNATLVTNGLGINEDISWRIGRAFHAVTFSLPAADRATFEAVRGLDVYEQVLANVRTVTGSCGNVALAVNLMRQNAAGASKVISLAAELGVRRVSFHRFIGTRRLDEWHLPPEGLAEAASRILEARKEHPEVEVTTRDPVLAHMLKLPHKPCIAGYSNISVEPDGRATPCRYLYEFLGDLTKDSMGGIVSGERFTQWGDVARLGGACRECALRNRCVGCRALASHYGDAHGEDPLCAVVRGGGGT